MRSSPRRAYIVAMDDAALDELTKQITSALAPVVRKELERVIDEALAGYVRRAAAPQEPAPVVVPVTKRRGRAPARKVESRAKMADLPDTQKAALAAIQAALVGHPEGLHAEKLREAMGLPGGVRRRLALVLRKAVASGGIRREGQRRGTTYFLKK